MAEHGVTADLLELCLCEPQPRCGAEVHRLAASNLYVEPLVAALDE